LQGGKDHWKLQIIVLYVPLNLRYFGKRGTPFAENSQRGAQILVHFLNCDETYVEIKYYFVQTSISFFFWDSMAAN
jgi:hypothetical protein